MVAILSDLIADRVTLILIQKETGLYVVRNKFSTYQIGIDALLYI